MDYNRLAELLFPQITTTPEDMEKRYPPRNLPEGAKVTRLAPSPTGFIHLGNLYGALVDERLAHQSGGIVYLRIEDTDSKREIENGVSIIIDTLAHYRVKFDEGATPDGDNGMYGPYRQSQRGPIYQTFAKQLVREGKAYPCFCSETELEQMRKEQESEKVTPGYHGRWAVWRDASYEKIEAALKEKGSFVLRFRSDGDASKSFRFTDMVKGEIDVTENDIDHVILKSDGIPTYHFAHAVDDHLMRTTHVVRDESWLSTLPFHIQLHKALGFKMPKYLHTAQVMKIDETSGGKRKLSKRKDPECGLLYYREQGYPVEVVREYIMTLLNSTFEDWRQKNPALPMEDYPFTMKKMAVSGCLFDFDKLADISKNVISRMSAEHVYEEVVDWAKDYDSEFFKLLDQDPDYAKRILSIGRGGNKPRKDLSLWSTVKEYMNFFYDDLFVPAAVYPSNIPVEDIETILKKYQSVFSEEDNQEIWFEKIKTLAQEIGYAPDMKLYKQDPTSYKGHVGDVAMVLRVAVTGKQMSPDTFECMRILGGKRVIERISKAIEIIREK